MLKRIDASFAQRPLLGVARGLRGLRRDGYLDPMQQITLL